MMQILITGYDAASLDVAYKVAALHGIENMSLVVGTIGHIDHEKTTVSKEEFIIENNRPPFVDFKMNIGEYIPKRRRNKRYIDFIAKRRK